jgi:hypothetical protein
VTLSIRPATAADVPVIADLIRALARYEKLERDVTMTEEMLASNLFGTRPYADTLLAEEAGKPIAFALYFYSFSTFLAKPGI